MDKLRRAVVAVEGDNGSVTYHYGWARDTTWTMARHPTAWGGFSPAVYTTTVEWATPPRVSTRYPTDAEFAAALPPSRSAIAPS